MSGNMENLKGMMSSGIQNLKDNPALQKVRQNVMNDLVNKAGLSEEQAQKIQDFQVSELIAVIQNEFFDEQGKPDMQKIMSKVNMQEIQAKAKEMLGGFDLGKLFK
jgi:polyhydroxyalkanoate synthesis regulator phasin